MVHDVSTNARKKSIAVNRGRELRSTAKKHLVGSKTQLLLFESVKVVNYFNKCFEYSTMNYR